MRGSLEWSGKPRLIAFSCNEIFYASVNSTRREASGKKNRADEDKREQTCYAQRR